MANGVSRVLRADDAPQIFEQSLLLDELLMLLDNERVQTLNLRLLPLNLRLLFFDGVDENRADAVIFHAFYFAFVVFDC